MFVAVLRRNVSSGFFYAFYFLFNKFEKMNSVGDTPSGRLTCDKTLFKNAHWNNDIIAIKKAWAFIFIHFVYRFDLKIEVNLRPTLLLLPSTQTQRFQHCLIFTELRSKSSAFRFGSLLTPFLQTVGFAGPQWPLSACHATPPQLCCHPSFLVGIVEAVELPCCHGSKHFHILPTLPAQCGHRRRHHRTGGLGGQSRGRAGVFYLPPWYQLPSQSQHPHLTFSLITAQYFTTGCFISLKIFLKSKFWPQRISCVCDQKVHTLREKTPTVEMQTNEHWCCNNFEDYSSPAGKVRKAPPGFLERFWEPQFSLRTNTPYYFQHLFVSR